ncbi:lipopolysaccharide biosynthesis protein [Cronobacter dublinensis subsp. dublinensis]|uniref:lipopolysaccharide biosynthesis protein n=1 Tax=Cronobacter dublinensis TaxID=413497 RepID=UPI00300E3BDA|nr:lipopolysaccharide biosynthesis protein [Cronobacter dublinensis subsp. dublinensis]EGT5687468.1 lipopolysaccharide biosynthesis protein [Cronobacter dublinensis subsp. dublinensis]EGT5699486.1 lipopolysaccharide biosynthesis protein [Cronobacter dublinensis subsp. dublinensis]EGT5729410.1 lipopolysaccharide biosynthesis protein [Cronobacter dublinensis subsp. dublinensis]EGT5733710.1 lipopolysaccharide biosynthesis protein [Cronobacter dublinensis subsp. dublinensis]
MVAKFIREIIVFLFVSGISRLLPFLLTPLFTHYLIPEEMGRLELILSLYNIFMVFGMCQLDTALQRYYHHSQSIPKTVFNKVLKLSLGTVLIYLIATPFLSSVLSLGPSAYIELSLSGICIVFSNLHIVNSLTIRYARTIKYVIFINMLQATLFAAMACYAVMVLKVGIKGYFCALLISYVTSVIISIVILKKEFKVKCERDDYTKLMQFSLPQLPGRIASVLGQYGNRFILYIIFTQSTIGLFALSNKIATLMLVGVSAFCMVWYPLLYDKNNKNALRNTRRIYGLVLVLLPIIDIILFIITWLVFKFFIPHSYAEAEHPTYIMIIAISLLIIKEMVDAGIKLSEKTKYISYIYISNTLVLFALIFAAGLLWGIMGVALAIFFSNVLLTYTTWYVSEKLYPMGFNINYCHIYMAFCLTSILSTYWWVK